MGGTLATVDEHGFCLSEFGVGIRPLGSVERVSPVAMLPHPLAHTLLLLALLHRPRFDAR